MPITDGPFAESKEFLAGYWLVDVESEHAATDAERRVVDERPGVEPGALDPDHVHTPGIFVKKIVTIPYVPTQAGGIREEK